MSYPFRIDVFSGAAADLKGAKRTDDNVLEALRRDPRISAFDMSEHYRWLQPIIRRLEREGKIREVEAAYPWLRYEITHRPKEANTMQTVEEEIQSKGLTAPRITPAHVEASIVAEQYYVFPGTTLTVCCLTLQNGFTVVGESACASPENFNPELGQRIARDNAKEKIWALEGYALRSKLAAATAAS